MADGRESEHSVLWHCSLLASSEYASLQQDGDRFRLQGIVALPLDDLPCRIDYQVVVDGSWLPLSAVITVATPEQVQEVDLATDGSGHWKLNGEPAPSLDGCSDVDLGWTPITNTIPIRRLDLRAGETEAISAAWVRFPELNVVRSDQRYERLAPDRWRYRSGAYDFELVTDPVSGLVLAYGDDLWRAVATAIT